MPHPRNEPQSYSLRAPRPTLLPAAAAGLAGRVALGVACGDGVALVVEAPSPGQGQLDLGPAVFEVDRQGDQREGLLLGLAHELVDLAAVQQELASSLGIVGAEARGVLVGGMWTPSSQASPSSTRA